MGGRKRGAPIRDQCAELRPLQNLRHQGPESEHKLGSTRGGRGSELFEYVTHNKINDLGGGVRTVAAELVLRCFLYVPDADVISGTPEGISASRSGHFCELFWLARRTAARASRVSHSTGCRATSPALREASETPLH